MALRDLRKTDMLIPSGAPLPSDVHKEAREEGLPHHISKWTKITEGDNSENAKHKVDFGSGVMMKLTRFPYLPKRGDKLADYGIPVSVRLLLKIIAEGSAVFFIMFLLSLGSLTNNNQRSAYRAECRRTASTPKGYAVLTNWSASSIADRADVKAQMESALGEVFDPRECGYDGMPIRHFEQASVDKKYQHAASATVLSTALGGCYEYRDCDPTVHAECDVHLLPGGPWTDNAKMADGNPLLIATPGAKYCLGFQDSSMTSQVMQFLSTVLFLSFLIRIRYLSQEYARHEDSSRITTSDYSLAFSGLDRSIAPDDLKKQLKEQLEALEVNGVPNYFTGRIHHVEVGRNCLKEVTLMNKLKRVTLRAEELEARKKYKQAKGKSVAGEVAALKSLVTDFTSVRKEMRRLIVEPDTSTGHAFVVFHEEIDRNKCYTHFNKKAGAKAGEKYGSAVEGPATLACANEPRTSSKPFIQRVFEFLCALQERRESLMVQAAPEPDQINWMALELDDKHEQKVVLLGRLLTLILVAIGAGCLLLAKYAQYAFKLTPAPGASALDTFLAEQSSKSAITAGVSCVTIGFNLLLKSIAIFLVHWEGQDTRTEEQASIFSKLSIALSMNTVLVPMFVGIFLSNGAVADQTWYEPGGIVSSIALLCIFNYVNDFIQVFNTPAIFQRVVLARFAYAKTTLIEYWKPFPFFMGNQYARCLVMMALGLVWGPLYPPAYAITALGLVLKWFCTRFGMHTWYAFPVNIDQEMMMALRWRLGNVCGVSAILQAIAIAQSVGLGLADLNSENGSKALSTAGLQLFGTPILVLLYTIIPLGYFKAFARFDQLEDTGDLDTGGLRFDEASEVTGFPMPHYVCPTLPNIKDPAITRGLASVGKSYNQADDAAVLSRDVVKATINANRCSAILTPYGLDKSNTISNLLGASGKKDIAAAMEDIEMQSAAADDGTAMVADVNITYGAAERI